MRLFTALIGFMALCLATVAQAGEKPLDKATMQKLLAGNTAVGTYRGKAFRQFFAADGGTTYVVQGDNPDVGKWIVTNENLYCSWWQRGGWSCYTMTGENESVTWHYEGSDPFPAKMVDGKQLAF